MRLTSLTVETMERDKSTALLVKQNQNKNDMTPQFLLMAFLTNYLSALWLSCVMLLDTATHSITHMQSYNCYCQNVSACGQFMNILVANAVDVVCKTSTENIDLIKMSSANNFYQ